MYGIEHAQWNNNRAPTGRGPTRSLCYQCQLCTLERWQPLFTSGAQATNKSVDRNAAVGYSALTQTP
eukprot:1606704-Amphidinium_carterae.1